MLTKALVVVAALAGGGSVSAADVDAWRAAARAHPDDPAIAWGTIGALESAGDLEDAIVRIRAFETRWPDRQPETHARLGRLLYAVGRPDDALSHLDRALVAHEDATTRFYRGLVLRSLGDYEASSSDLLRAARGEAAFASEAGLLRGLNSLDEGDDSVGLDLLREVVREFPRSEAARNARVILGNDTSSRPVVLAASIGTEWDSNVTLDSGTEGSSVASERRDGRIVAGASAIWHAFRGETTKLDLGYRFNESLHDELDVYDQRTHIAFASFAFDAADGVTGRLDGVASDGHLDDERYARSWTVRPNLYVQMGPTLGRFYADVERVRYHDAPLFDSLERGGTSYGLGYEHYFKLWRPGAWTALGARYANTHTRASTDAVLGFDGAFDKSRSELTFRMSVPLENDWNVVANLLARSAWDRYDHENLIDALFSGDRNPRKDWLAELSLGLSLPVTPWLDAELRWRGTRQVSNVAVYDYDRQVLGLHFKVQTR